MRRLKSCSSVSLLFFFCVGISISYAANDTLRFGESMTNGSFLESSNKIFQLVFFSYDSLEQRYLGIQHMQIPDLNNNGKQRMVWVANRNNPSSINSSSNLTITQDGNLVINDHDIGISITLNSGNPATSIANASVTLLDSGNLVFRDGETTVWQSFDYPSDTWLPGMKLGLFDMNDTTGGKPPRQQFLTSWVSPKVPTPGTFTLGIDPSNTKQLVVWQRGVIYWSSGLWNGYNFTYFPHWRNWDANLESNFSYFSDERESYFNNSRTINNFAISIGMDSSGEIYIFKSYPPRGLVHDGILRCEAPLVEERSEGCIKIPTTADKDRPRRKLWLIIGGPCATLLVLAALSLFCYLRWGNWLFRGAINDLSHDAKKQELIGKDHELPLFDFSSIQFATDQFSDANKIGQGGFGPVYKGKLVGGQEIAVKRLSRSSGQGLEEFKNEVILISKLQHRNLVKLLGCCTHGDERILVYEYLQNKSLDSFLFDATKRALLDWKLRVCIIEGIAQGLIYLHKYSRLKIIHRDLKASNVLLDNDMNPKISDFGTARIFRENESRANTIRIVGTYGYMSPEYAMDGLFSEKSDVFSFGVMMLEIISGEKNTGFYQPDRCLNLLGYAWDLWKEGRGVELMDQELVETCPTSEVFMRYIQVGLLCVQESAADRPVMSNVMSMLSNEMMILPAPKKPAFSNIVCTVNYSTSSEAPYPCSKNEITISEVQAR